MKTIWKFPIAVADINEIEMPANAVVLSVQAQDDIACIWAMVRPEAPKEWRRFRMVGTGHDIPDHVHATDHLGTFQVMDGRLVFHLFEERP